MNPNKSCARPTGGPVRERPQEKMEKDQELKGEMTMIQVDKKAPDFVEGRNGL